VRIAKVSQLSQLLLEKRIVFPLSCIGLGNPDRLACDCALATLRRGPEPIQPEQRDHATAHGSKNSVGINANVDGRCNCSLFEHSMAWIYQLLFCINALTNCALLLNTHEGA
jgi:hypothetical protein